MSAATAIEAVEDVEIDSIEPTSNRRRWLLIGAVLLAAIAAILFATGILAGYVSTDDAFVEVPMVYVAGQVSGRVIEIVAAEHQRVEKGDILLRLEATEFELALLRAEATLSLAGNRVIKAKAAAAATDADRKAATAELWRSERELVRLRSLLASNSASQSDFDAAQATYDAGQAKVRALALRAEAELALLHDDAQVRQAEAEKRSAELNLSRTVVRAPFSGTVGRRSVEIGTVVNAGRPLLALVSDEEVTVMANFKETQLDGVEIGSHAEVTIDAFPGVVWDGRVASFSPATGTQYALLSPEPAAGSFTKVVQRIPVKIVLDAIPVKGEPPSASGLSLADGLSAEVSISIE
jgi:membrane fusion protein (multidrug efflux system)